MSNLRWLASAIEYVVVRTLGALLGVGFVVRYLRNPNPLLTAKILRAYGACIGKGTTFKRSVRIDNAFEDANAAGDFSHLVVGRNCYIGDDVYFDLAHRVVIGDDVVVSGEVAFVTHADCNRSPFLAPRMPRQCAPVTVQDGAWICFRASLLAGVTVGAGAVVAGHALVRTDVEPRSVHVGAPAKLLRRLDDAAA